MSENPPVEITAIYRYPVKGLSPEPLPRVALTPGQTLPADRRYAIENGPSGFDPAAPQYCQKTRFLMLERNERLAALHTLYDDFSHILTVSENGREVARGDLRTAEGCAAIDRFFAANFSAELDGRPPKILSGNGHSFSDVSQKVVSIVNLASLQAIEDVVGQPVHPLRFRANLYVRGWPAWHEFDLLNQTLAVGDVRLKVLKRIGRCPAINVDPDTAIRDLDIKNTLEQHFSHRDCGIYAEVIEGGEIAEGDEVRIE